MVQKSYKNRTKIVQNSKYRTYTVQKLYIEGKNGLKLIIFSAECGISHLGVIRPSVQTSIEVQLLSKLILLHRHHHHQHRHLVAKFQTQDHHLIIHHTDQMHIHNLGVKHQVRPFSNQLWKPEFHPNCNFTPTVISPQF